MNALATYDAARQALAAARDLPSILDVRDRAQAIIHLARIAKDRELEITAAELRFDAERQLGVMIGAQRDTIGLSQGGRPSKKPGANGTRLPSLEEAGIDKRLAHRARAYAAMPAGAFAARLAQRREDIVAGRKRVTLDLLDEDKAAKRAAREVELGARICALPDKRFGVIYDDPEWRHEVWSRETGLDRCPDNHYPTSTVAEIMARDIEMIRAIAAPDCAWFRWVPNQHLANGIRSIEIEGFTYRSNFVWAKDRLSTGYWNRSEHEILLLAVRGDVPCPAPGTQVGSIFRYERTVHSAKPEAALDMIEAYFPHLPKIELNRRGAARPGWDAWGNEVEEATELPTTCLEIAQKLVAAGFAHNEYLLKLNGVGDGYDRRAEYPWSLPSRAFGFCLDFKDNHLVLRQAALLEHPIVAEIAAKVGVRPIVQHDSRSMSSWHHAVDLMTEAHWRDLLDTRRFTTTDDLFRALGFALEKCAYTTNGRSRSESSISIATARLVLAELEAPEPADRSRAALLDPDKLRGGRIVPEGRKTPVYPLNLMARGAEGAWMMVHGLEDGWFVRGRDGHLQISEQGRAWRGPDDADTRDAEAEAA